VSKNRSWLFSQYNLFSIRRLFRLFFVFGVSFSSISALTFYCNFAVRNFDSFTQIYSCEFNVTEDASDLLTAVSGTHLPGKTNSMTEGVSAPSAVNLTFIPRNLASFFPNIKVLYWAAPQFSSISSDDLKFPLLEYFVCANNQLTSIDGNLFEFSRNLRAISFYNTKLQHVGHNLLVNLPQLQQAWFQHNTCISTYTEDQQGIKNLDRNLPIFCPPLSPTLPTTTPATTTSTPPEYCSYSCLDEIKLEINELKKQMRELLASPCSCLN
jgi:hypothetical protein